MADGRGRRARLAPHLAASPLPSGSKPALVAGFLLPVAACQTDVRRTATAWCLWHGEHSTSAVTCAYAPSAVAAWQHIGAGYAMQCMGAGGAEHSTGPAQVRPTPPRGYTPRSFSKILIGKRGEISAGWFRVSGWWLVGSGLAIFCGAGRRGWCWRRW